MDELVDKIRSQLIDLVDNHKVSMLQMSKDIGISYQGMRRLILEPNRNPTSSTLRKAEQYLLNR